jgi:hypothetical protein
MGGLLQAVRAKLGGVFGGDSSSGQQDNARDNSGGLDLDKALKYTQDRWTELKNAYVVYHQAIWEALLFYAGQMWLDWDDARKVWQPQQPNDEWVPRPRINRFSPTVDAIASNFYQLPEVEAVASDDNDPSAHAVADICSDLADYAVQKEGLKSQQGEKPDKVGLAAQLFVLTGGVITIIRVNQKEIGQAPQKGMGPAVGYHCEVCDKYVQTPGTDKPNFCPECGSPVDVSDTEMMQDQLDDAGNPVMNTQTENELELEIGNQLFAFPRPGSTCMDDSPYLLWAKRRTLEDIWFRWQFEADADAIWPDGYSVTYEHSLNFWYTGYSSSTTQIKDSCMVLEMYVAPNKVKDVPSGFIATIINDKVVPNGTQAWAFPENPLTMGKYLDLPTIFFARSVSFDLVPIQRELNAYEAIIKLHAMVAAADPIVVDADSLVSEVTGRSDKLIKFRMLTPQTEPPHRMGHGSLDAGVYTQRDNLHAEFQNISMAVNSFRGQQEGAVTAAAAIQQLRSQAELMFNKPAGNWRNLWRETIRKYIKFMQKYYSFEQLAKILGEDREDDIRSFQEADLDTMVDWVASDHGLPRTRDELRQEMMTLFDKGALDINDPAVREKVFQLFGETGMMQSFNKDATNARLENQAFKQGMGQPGQPYQVPQIKPMPIIEDMPVHLYFHKDQAKSRDFQKWPPEAQQALIQHIMQTQTEIQMMQGPPPGPQGKPAQLTDGKNTQGQNPQLAQPTPVAAAS